MVQYYKYSTQKLFEVRDNVIMVGKSQERQEIQPKNYVLKK